MKKSRFYLSDRKLSTERYRQMLFWNFFGKNEKIWNCSEQATPWLPLRVRWTRLLILVQLLDSACRSLVGGNGVDMTPLVLNQSKKTRFMMTQKMWKNLCIQQPGTSKKVPNRLFWHVKKALSSVWLAWESSCLAPYQSFFSMWPKCATQPFDVRMRKDIPSDPLISSGPHFFARVWHRPSQFPPMTTIPFSWPTGSVATPTSLWRMVGWRLRRVLNLCHFDRWHAFESFSKNACHLCWRSLGFNRENELQSFFFQVRK